MSSNTTTAAPVAITKVTIRLCCWTSHRTCDDVLVVLPTDPVCVDQDYQSLCDKLREISTLGGISGLLQWDEAVMMPAGAAESRGKQKSVLAGVVYEKVCTKTTV